MDAIKLSENLWLTANLIAGFALVQMIALGFAAIEDKINFAHSKIGPVAMYVMITIGYGCYLVGTYWCGSNAIEVSRNLSPPLSDTNASLMRIANFGRVAIVVIAWLCAIVVVFIRTLPRDVATKRSAVESRI